jgi:hypothetical protein
VSEYVPDRLFLDKSEIFRNLNLALTYFEKHATF